MRTITAHTEIDELFARGRRVSHPALLVLVARTPAERGNEGRVLFVAGKRLGGAVVRNRAKRLLRAAARRAETSWEGWDVALIAREATLRANPATLDGALKTALRTLEGS